MLFEKLAVAPLAVLLIGTTIVGCRQGSKPIEVQKKPPVEETQNPGTGNQGDTGYDPFGPTDDPTTTEPQSPVVDPTADPNATSPDVVATPDNSDSVVDPNDTGTSSGTTPDTNTNTTPVTPTTPDNGVPDSSNTGGSPQVGTQTSAPNLSVNAALSKDSTATGVIAAMSFEGDKSAKLENITAKFVAGDVKIADVQAKADAKGKVSISSFWLPVTVTVSSGGFDCSVSNYLVRAVESAGRKLTCVPNATNDDE